MKRMFVAVLAALAAPVALAEPSTWNLDPAHSQATFAVRHLAISTVRGEFKAIDGKLAIDDQDPTRSKVDVTIDANSIDTRNEKRDAHLKSADFFDVANNPKITFKSTKIEKAGEGYKVTGDLTIRGNSKPVTLEVDEFTKPIKDPQGASRRAIHATGKLNRKDYGLAWSKVVEAGPVVADEVKMEISAEFVQAPASPLGQAKAEDAAAKKSEKADAKKK
jgi:polyisoprenoid-binding protein YceI